MQASLRKRSRRKPSQQASRQTLATQRIPLQAQIRSHRRKTLHLNQKMAGGMMQLFIFEPQERPPLLLLQSRPTLQKEHEQAQVLYHWQEAKWMNQTEVS